MIANVKLEDMELEDMADPFARYGQHVNNRVIDKASTAAMPRRKTTAKSRP